MPDLHDLLDYLPNANAYFNNDKHYIATTCLFHNDSNPSLIIHETTYSCMSCGAHGRTSQLLKMLETGKIFSKKETKYYPQLWRCLQDEDTDIEDLSLEAYKRLQSGNRDNQFYLKKRGIPPNWIKKLLIGYYQGWYTFPIISDDYEIAGLVARAGETMQTQSQFRYMTPPGQPVMLYVPDWKLIQSSPYIMVVYGIIDAITLAICGFPAMSFSQGHKSPPELLSSYRKKIYLIPDGDAKDDKTVMDLALALGWRGKIMQLPYPDGAKDCNDLLVKLGEDGLKSLLEEMVKMDSIYKLKIRKEQHEAVG